MNLLEMRQEKEDDDFYNGYQRGVMQGAHILFMLFSQASKYCKFLHEALNEIHIILSFSLFV